MACKHYLRRNLECYCSASASQSHFMKVPHLEYFCVQSEKLVEVLGHLLFLPLEASVLY